jgi:polysaccharide biosynthesis protein PslG
MRRRARLGLARLAAAIAVLATLSAQPAAAAAAPVAPADGYGFGDGAQLTWISMDDVNRELDAVAKTTASWLRVVIDWNRIEPAKGQFDWQQLDHTIDAARARNLKVLGMIEYSPEWARAPGAYVSAPPVNSSDYANFVTTVVRRYSPVVSTWQLWNEPNAPGFFGYAVGNAPRYAELVKAAYPTIKALQPDSTVVLAGLTASAGDDAAPVFMDQLYLAGIAGYFDAAAAHPYVYPYGLAQSSGWSDVERIHAVMAVHGDGAKKIWMTEIGAPTSDDAFGVSQQEQAKQITDVLAAAASTAYSGPAFIYSIRDENTSKRGDQIANFGALLTSDWQPKFTAHVLAE